MEKSYSQKAYIAKIKRLIESLEKGKAFVIQVKGRKIRIPADSEISIEFEKEGKKNELEFQIKWQPLLTNPGSSNPSCDQDPLYIGVLFLCSNESKKARFS